MKKSKTPPKKPELITVPAEEILKLPDEGGAIDYIELFKSIIEGHSNNPKWAKGRLIGIKTLANTKVGDVGQDFIEALCEALKIPIIFPANKKNQRSKRSPWDLKLQKITFELKTATEDTGGNFQFNHIRYHREYQAVLCLGVSPDGLFFNIYSKADIATGKSGRLVSMEKGANASYKLTKSKNQLLPLDQFEERLKEVVESIIS